MTTGETACIGYAPIVTEAIDERYKYEQMWKHDEYRAVAPGEGVAMTFLQQAMPKADADIIDFGAGTGRGALMLALLGAMKVHMLDFASNCLDEDVVNAIKNQPPGRLKFTQHDLTKPVPISAKYGYCTDVMEHIPPHQVNLVLTNILRAAEHVFFQISCEDDVCGKLIGHPLHLSVHPYKWWHDKLSEFGCVIHWSNDLKSSCMFYVSAWQKATEFVNNGVLNTEEQKLLDNVKFNIAQGWKQATPHQVSKRDDGELSEIMILCGGPSLNGSLDEIRRLKAEGVKVVTTNNTYNWARDHGLFPVNQVVVDGRPMNARFTHPVDDRCLYFIASQVDPSVLEGLPKERTYLWHTNAEKLKEVLDAQYDVWYNTPGGSTVALRSIPLFRMLGFKRFHMFGFDSCLREEADGLKHHAFEQPENDGQLLVPVNCGDRKFVCHPWMVSQAQEFQDLIRFLGEEIELKVYGDGLIAYQLKCGAELAELDPTDTATTVLDLA